MLAGEAGAAVPGSWTVAAARAAPAWGWKRPIAGAVPAAAERLARGVLWGMIVMRLKIGAAGLVVLAGGAFLAGMAIAANRQDPEGPSEPKPPAVAVEPVEIGPSEAFVEGVVVDERDRPVGGRSWTC